MSKQHLALVLSIFAPWFWQCIVQLVLLCAMCICVLCVSSNTLVLRCMLSIFCVKEADLHMMAFVAYFALWLSEWYTVFFHRYHAQCNA